VTKIQPTVDADFMALCPTLADEELRLLRESIVAEGCRNPIICWDSAPYPILDGHHRFNICQGEGLPFEVRLLKLPDKAAARRWILSNQLGRRNLTDAQRALLRGHLYNETKGERGRPPDSGIKAQNEPFKSNTHKAAEHVASRDGVSQATVRRDAAFAKATQAVLEKVPDLKEPIERGIIPKEAVKGLAKTPTTELQKLTKLEPPAMRKTASQLGAKYKPARGGKSGRSEGRPPKSGDQKRDPRIWGQIEEFLGRALNRVDELNKQYPNTPMHKTLSMQIKQCMKTLKGWKESPK